jgi:hypothetical protein
MTPTTNVIAHNKVNEIIDSVETLDQCGDASKVIDAFTEDFPKEKEAIQLFRDILCEKTFEVYYKTKY